MVEQENKELRYFLNEEGKVCKRIKSRNPLYLPLGKEKVNIGDYEQEIVHVISRESLPQLLRFFDDQEESLTVQIEQNKSVLQRLESLNTNLIPESVDLGFKQLLPTALEVFEKYKKGEEKKRNKNEVVKQAESLLVLGGQLVSYLKDVEAKKNSMFNLEKLEQNLQELRLDREEIKKLL